MKKCNSLFVLLLSVTGIFCMPVNASMQHANKAKVSSCSDVMQPASIKCAAAPSAVFDAKGRLWAAWAYAGHVYVNYSDDQGKSFSAARVVNQSAEKISARGENRPKIQLDEKGNIYISWTTPLKKRFTGNIKFSYSEDGGKSFSEPVIVNNNRDITGHRFDALGVNKQGEIYIAWLDKRDRLAASIKSQNYHGAAVYFTWSDDAGKTFKTDKKIIDHSCECCRVIIDFDEKDLPVILWRNIYGKNIRDHALVDFKSKGTPDEPVRVSYDNWKIDACPHHGPDMSINDRGEQHLVWFNNATDSHGLFYAKRNRQSGVLSPAITFGDYSKTASHASVIHDKDSVWLSWKQFDGKQESVWLQKSIDNGVSWLKPELVASTNKSADYPFLLKNNHNIYIQWKTETQGFQLLSVN